MSLFGWINRRGSAPLARERLKVLLAYERTLGANSDLVGVLREEILALIRRHAPRELYRAPLRLLSAPEQDVVVRELLQRHAEAVSWPPELDRALETRGFTRRQRDSRSLG